jgi:hypothetical protein
VANFEFRTLAGYLVDLARSKSATEISVFVRDYLRAKSRYHARMAQFLAELAPESTERMATRGGLATQEVRQRLDKAAAFADGSRR